MIVVYEGRAHIDIIVDPVLPQHANDIEPMLCMEIADGRLSRQPGPSIRFRDQRPFICSYYNIPRALKHRRLLPDTVYIAVMLVAMYLYRFAFFRYCHL